MPDLCKFNEKLSLLHVFPKKSEINALELRDQSLENHRHAVCGRIGGGDDHVAVGHVLFVVYSSSSVACATSVITDMPKTGTLAWRATMTSGTVLMPTASAPMFRKKRYSAGVS